MKRVVVPRLIHFLGPSLLVGLYIKDNFQIVQVNGISMHPTIDHGDVLLGYKSSEYKVGDVILLQSPTNGSLQIKRLISRNKVVLDPNSKFCKISTHHGIILPQGKLWVEGDFNSHSLDSNHYGPIPESCIVAKMTYNLFKRKAITSEMPIRYQYRLSKFKDLFIQHPWYFFYN